MRFKLSLPGWIERLIEAAAAFLAGAAAQRSADQRAGEAATAKVEKTVEDAAREVGALTDDEVNEELKQWQSKH